ncbi:MAG: hypothetical protein ACR2LR_02460 [Hassallia sp.]
MQIQAEIAAIRSQIDAFQEERATLTINDVVVSKENSSPLAIAEAYRHHATEIAQISTEVKGIDDAIAALKGYLEEKQVKSGRLSTVSFKALLVSLVLKYKTKSFNILRKT